MADNYLEQLVSEWYSYQGYFIRQNVHVGKRDKGGYDCELDVIAFHPQKQLLVHIEPSMDTDSWATRETRYKRKFEAGMKHIPGIFKGFKIPKTIEQIALFAYASSKNHPVIGGGKVVTVREIFQQIATELKDKKVATDIVSQSLPILRTIQFMQEYKQGVC